MSYSCKDLVFSWINAINSFIHSFIHDSNPELAHDRDHESALLAHVDVVDLVDDDRADEPDGESDDGPHAIEESLGGER